MRDDLRVLSVIMASAPRLPLKTPDARPSTGSGETVYQLPHLEKEADLGQGIELILGFLEDGPLSRDEIMNRFGQEDAAFADKVIHKMEEMKLIREQDNIIHLVN